MKKIWKYICLIFTALVLTACFNDALTGSFDIQITGVQGVSDVTVDTDTNTISFDVAPSITTFDVKGIQTAYDTINIVPVTSGTSTSTIVQLQDGKNIFTINFSGTITYLGVQKEVSEDWTLEINKLTSASIQSISIFEWKTEYFINELFSEGLLRLSYTDGTSYNVVLRSSMVSGFDTSKEGVVSVTITYVEFTITTDITISKQTDNLESIEVTTWQLNYSLNSKYSEGRLLLTYSTGNTSQIAITEDMISGFDTTVEGEFTVTISYGGFTISKNIFVIDNSVGEDEQVQSDTLTELMFKVITFFNSGEVEGTDEFDNKYNKFYMNFIECGGSIESVIELCHENGITNNDVLNALKLADDNLADYREFFYGFEQFFEETNTALEISKYIFEDWDRHMEVVSSINELVTSSQLTNIFIYSVSYFNNGSNAVPTFDDFKNHISDLDNNSTYIDVMEKYYDVIENSEYTPLYTEWYDVAVSVQGIINVLVSFDKDDLELATNTIINVFLDFENVSTSDLTKTINIIGEIVLEFYDELPSYDFVIELVKTAFQFDLFYPDELVKVIALVFVDFTSDDMLEIIDILNASTEYMMVEILHVLSDSIIKNIDLVYGNQANFEVEMIKYFTNINSINIDTVGQFAKDIYTLITDLSNTPILTEVNKETFNSSLMELLDTTFSFIESNPFSFYVYNSSHKSFVVSAGLTENEFYAYLNANSRFYYNGMEINFSSEICSSIDLNKIGTQYLVINIGGAIYEIPVYISGDKIDLDIVDYSYYISHSYLSIDGDDTYIFLDPNGNVVSDSYVRFKVTYYEAQDDVYYSFNISNWYSDSEMTYEIIYNDLTPGKQNGLISINFFGEEVVYIPMKIFVCEYDETITETITLYGTYYVDVNSMDDIILSHDRYYLSESPYYDTYIRSENTLLSIDDVTLYNSIDFSKSESQTLSLNYNDKDYTLKLFIEPCEYYIINNVYLETTPGISIGDSSDNLYFYTVIEMPNAILLKNRSINGLDTYLVAYVDLVAYAKTFGVTVELKGFDSSKTGCFTISMTMSSEEGNQVLKEYFTYYVFGDDETIVVSSIMKLTSYDYHYHSSFNENVLSVDDCIAINDQIDLYKYSIEFYQKNSIRYTWMNLADFVDKFNAEVYIDIDSQQLIINAFDSIYTIDITILHTIVPYYVSFYSAGTYYLDTNSGFVYVSIYYRDNNTGDFYCYEVERYSVSYLNVEEYTGYQVVNVYIYGLLLETEVFVLTADSEFSIEFNNQYFNIGIDDIDNFQLTGQILYLYSDYYQTIYLSSENYTILNLDSIDMTTLGWKNLIIEFDGEQYNISMYVRTPEYFISDMIVSTTNKSLLDEENPNIIINRYIENSTPIRTNYYFYSGFYSISIEDFINYASNLGVVVTTTDLINSQVGYTYITLTIGTLSKNVYYNVVKNYYFHSIIPIEITSDSGMFELEDINKIVSGENLDEYYLNFYGYGYYDTYIETMSFLELKIKYNAKFSVLNDKLVITMLGNVYTF